VAASARDGKSSDVVAAGVVGEVESESVSDGMGGRSEGERRVREVSCGEPVAATELYAGRLILSMLTVEIGVVRR
jgi:hypothetical protein